MFKDWTTNLLLISSNKKNPRVHNVLLFHTIFMCKWVFSYEIHLSRAIDIRCKRLGTVFVLIKYYISEQSVNWNVNTIRKAFKSIVFPLFFLGVHFYLIFADVK